MFNYLEEAKRLQKKYEEQGNKDCYCNQNGSTAECPAHIDTYITSLERYDNPTSDNSGDSDSSSKRRRKE